MRRGIPAVMLLALLAGCESPFVRPEASPEVDFEVEIDSMPPVYAGGGRMLVYQTAWVEGELYEGDRLVRVRRVGIREEEGRLFARGTLPALPPQPRYLLWARAVEAHGSSWCEGSTTFSLTPGQRRRIHLHLKPLTEVVQTFPWSDVGNIVEVPLPGCRSVVWRLSVPIGQGG